jgi:hypothetical protein
VPRHERPPRRGPFVVNFVEDLKPLVRQANFVCVEGGEQPDHLSRPRPECDGAVPAPDVTGRLVHPSQERFDPFPDRDHVVLSLPSATSSITNLEAAAACNCSNLGCRSSLTRTGLLLLRRRYQLWHGVRTRINEHSDDRFLAAHTYFASDPGPPPNRTAKAQKRS